MYYCTPIDNPVEGLEQISTAIAKFDDQRFLAAVEHKPWNQRNYELLTDQVCNAQKKLAKQFKSLEEFSQAFNKQFATPDNHCYESAQLLLKKISAGIQNVKKIYQRFCPRARQEKANHPMAQTPVPAWNHSYISTSTYQTSLFTVDTYPPFVQALFNELNKFFGLLAQSIQLCEEVLATEQLIKENPQQCLMLLNDYRDMVIDEINQFVGMMGNAVYDINLDNCPIVQSWTNRVNEEAWAQNGFHQHTPFEMRMLLIKQTLEEQKRSELTNEEVALFGCDRESVKKYREIIAHFDLLLPEGYSRKSLPAPLIQMFLLYINVPEGKLKQAVAYFNKVYQASSHNQLKTVGYTAVQAYREELKEKDTKEYKAFVAQVERLFFPITPNQKEVG